MCSEIDFWSRILPKEPLVIQKKMNKFHQHGRVNWWEADGIPGKGINKAERKNRANGKRDWQVGVNNCLAKWGMHYYCEVLNLGQCSAHHRSSTNVYSLTELCYEIFVLEKIFFKVLVKILVFLPVAMRESSSREEACHAFQFQGSFPLFEVGVAAGAWGSWSHCAQSDSLEKWAHPC